MIPAAFDYHSPKSLDDALALLGKLGDDAKILAGGHSLLPALKLRLVSVGHLVDLSRIPGLAYVKEDGGAIAIGAMTSHHAVESDPILGKKCPLLAECAASIGDVQVRNRGTIGGSLAHADPAADYPAGVLALDAEIRVRGPKGARSIAADGFFVDMLQTALQAGEIVTEVRVAPFAAKTGGAYLKVPQPASGFAIVGVAAVVTLDGGGRCSKVRIGVTGMASKAFRAKDAEAAVTGKAPDEASLAAAAAAATSGVDASGDVFASSEYRTHLTGVYVRRALAKAVERAKAA